MTATHTITIDDRPLHERLGEALKEREVAHKAVVGTATLLGAASGAGIGYINHLISLAFYAWIGMPSWFMTIATWSGYFGIAYLGLAGAWLCYSLATDR